MFSQLFGKRSESSAEDIQQPQTPTTHKIEIKWDNWSPPGENDVRSPCPAINSLANHNILPHNGKNITKPMAIDALTTAFNLDPKIATVFATSGIFANPHHTNTPATTPSPTFDLDMVNKHNYIEHDVSLSRGDYALGGGTKFDAQAFDGVLAVYRAAHPGKSDDEISTDWGTAGRARWARVLQSKGAHDAAEKTWVYGIKEAIMSYGETALYLNLLGRDGVAPLEWVRIFFEQERLPYAEGWRPPVKFDQADLNHGYAEMMKGGEHAVEEAKLVGLGTLVGLKEAILSLGAGGIKAIPKFL